MVADGTLLSLNKTETHHIRPCEKTREEALFHVAWLLRARRRQKVQQKGRIEKETKCGARASIQLENTNKEKGNIYMCVPA